MTGLLLLALAARTTHAQLATGQWTPAYATPLVVQTTESTGKYGPGGRAASNSYELDAAYGYIDGGALHLLLTGNIVMGWNIEGQTVWTPIDVFLDTLPWSGHTTTMHGLWMGVPTVTVEQAHHAGRFSTMVMRNLGLEECIAPDAASFAAKVAALVANKSLLQRLRREGRQLLAASPLMDHDRLATRFMAACEAMWDAQAAR